MKCGDIVRHCKLEYEGVIIEIAGEYVGVLLTKTGMYRPQYFKIDELEVINEMAV